MLNLSVEAGVEPNNVCGEAFSEEDSCVSVNIQLVDVPKPVDDKTGAEPVDVGPELVP